jgi:hypothetical protein
MRWASASRALCQRPQAFPDRREARLQRLDLVGRYWNSCHAPFVDPEGLALPVLLDRFQGFAHCRRLGFERGGVGIGNAGGARPGLKVGHGFPPYVGFPSFSCPAALIWSCSESDALA